MANYTVDIELTNRCNADCYFCPRDATPHQGLMSDEVFEQTLVRAVELRDLNHALDPTTDTTISMCGLGEPLIHKRAAEYVRRARELDFYTGMSTNGSLLDERRGPALLEAGLQVAYINVGERDEGYRDIYKLPFEKTRDNVVRFAEMAEGQCQVVMVLVDHRRDKDHVAAMEQYWRDLGIDNFVTFGIMNRGGSLFVDHMQYDQRPEVAVAAQMIAAREGEAICAVPFLSTFVGYDGNVYLCCSDWKKEAPIASVFDDACLDRMPKLRLAADRHPVCVTCNLDPLNHLADEIKAHADGADDAEDVEELADTAVRHSEVLHEAVARFDAIERRDAGDGRRRIPVRSV